MSIFPVSIPNPIIDIASDDQYLYTLDTTSKTVTIYDLYGNYTDNFVLDTVETLYFLSCTGGSIYIANDTQVLLVFFPGYTIQFNGISSGITSITINTDAGYYILGLNNQTPSVVAFDTVSLNPIPDFPTYGSSSGPTRVQYYNSILYFNDTNNIYKVPDLTSIDVTLLVGVYNNTDFKIYNDILFVSQGSVVYRYDLNGINLGRYIYLSSPSCFTPYGNVIYYGSGHSINTYRYIQPSLIQLPYRYSITTAPDNNIIDLNIPDLPFLESVNSRNLMVGIEYLNIEPNEDTFFTLKITSKSLSNYYSFDGDNYTNDGLLYLGNVRSIVQNNITSDTICYPIPYFRGTAIDLNFRCIDANNNISNVLLKTISISLIFYRYSGNDGF